MAEVNNLDSIKHYGAYLSFESLFSVTAYKEEQFKRINGFSNEYWGWGGEDDDLYHRMRKVF